MVGAHHVKKITVKISNAKHIFRRGWHFSKKMDKTSSLFDKCLFIHWLPETYAEDNGLNQCKGPGKNGESHDNPAVGSDSLIYSVKKVL